LRSYYSDHRWTPRFSAPPPAAAAKTRRGSRGAAVVFVLSLALILALCAALVVVTLSDFRAQAALPFGDSGDFWNYWENGDDWEEDAGSWSAPALRQAETGDGTVLSLSTAEDREALTFQEIYQKNIDSIVSVHVYGSNFAAFGTGIVLSEDGYIVTNAHVVSEGKRVVVSLHDGTELNCDLVGFDPYSDLAVLRTYPKTPLVPAEFGDSGELQVGDLALALGNPLGTELWGTMTDGIVSAINRDVAMEDGTTMTLIQTTAAINSGNSGGALLNDRGQVVGITNLKIIASDDTIEGLGFAIPSATVKEVVDAMLATGSYEGTPSIGITGSASREEPGVLVHWVDPASDAYAQGVQEGDVITAVNGRAVTSVEEINALKAGLSVGDSLTLTLLREGRTLTVAVTLVGSYALDR
jgi:serine protease Do